MSTAPPSVESSRDWQPDVRAMTTIAFGLGVASTIPFLVTDLWAYAVVAVAGVLVGWLIPRRRHGLGGLLGGVTVGVLAWGGFEVVAKLRSCADDGCSGMSSPVFTVLLVVAFIVAALLSAAVGYGVGRFVHSVKDGGEPGNAMSGLGSTNRSLFQALVVVVILVAAGIGARVDWLWWPVTSGLMLTLTAIAIGVVGGVLAFTRGVARRAGLVGLAVSVGLLAGQNLGPSREPLHNLEGTITLRLTSPVHGVATGAVSCSTVADATEVSVSSDPNLRLDTPDRPFVSISIDVGDRWVVLRDSPRNDGVYLLITVTPTRVPDDGEPATIGMAATETSTLSTTFASESGYVTFADLGPQFGVDFTGERLELAGMIEWTCDRDPSEGVDPDVVGQG